MYIPFIGAAYISRSRQIDCQECVNFYPELQQGSSKNIQALIGTPGLKLFAAVTGGTGWRGFHVTSTNRLFGACGNKIYEINENGYKTEIGQIYTNVGAVHFADNGSVANQLIIVDGFTGYVVNLKNNELNKIESEEFPQKPSHVIFKDGYFIVNRGDTGQFFFCNPYDAETWDASNFATVEGSPDNLLAIAKTNNEIIFFGNQSTEWWWNTGAADVPFQRISNAYVDIGTDAPHSVATHGNTVIWIGSNARGHSMVWAADGYNPVRISTHAIEYLLSSFSKISDAIAYCYQQEGHNFYQVNFPTAGRTLVYDLTTGLWHERGKWNQRRGLFEMHRSSCHAFFAGKNLVGDYLNGNIYEYDLDTYTDNGDIIRRVRTCPHLHNEMNRVFYSAFELDMERGVGLQTGQGNTPQVMLQWSNDGGFTWGAERWKTAGKVGEYRQRVKWASLGSARDRVFRVAVTDPVKWVLINAKIEAKTE